MLVKLIVLYSKVTVLIRHNAPLHHNIVRAIYRMKRGMELQMGQQLILGLIMVVQIHIILMEVVIYNGTLELGEKLLGCVSTQGEMVVMMRGQVILKFWDLIPDHFLVKKQLCMMMMFLELLV